MNDLVVSPATSMLSIRCSSSGGAERDRRPAPGSRPRVKSAEPWVRGSTPVSMRDRPDGVEVAAVHPLALAPAPAPASPGTRSPRARRRSPRPRSGNSASSCGQRLLASPPSRRARAAGLVLGVDRLRHRGLGQLARPAPRSSASDSRLGPLPSSAARPPCRSAASRARSASRMPFCATLSASSISASETSSEPPSTMTIESAEPLTTRSMVENSSCWKVGLRIQLPSTRPTRTAGQRPVPRHRRQAERGRGRHDAEHVGVVLLVGGEHGDEDLDLVLEALGEERPDRAVDQPAGQDLLVRGPALALEEPARESCPRRRSSRGIRRSGGRTGGWRCWGRRSRRPAPSCRRTAPARSRRPASPGGRSRA